MAPNHANKPRQYTIYPDPLTDAIFRAWSNLDPPSGDDGSIPASRAGARPRASYPETNRNNCGTTDDDDLPFWLSDDYVRRRRGLANYLQSFDNPKLVKLGMRLNKCRTSFGVFRDNFKDTHRAFLLSCDSKYCPSCQVIRSAERARIVSDVIQPYVRAGSLSMATLTIPNVKPNHLADRLPRLRLAFRRLFGKDGGRSKPLGDWAKVNGYICNFEITYNRKTDTYHPHLHVLIDAPYLRQSNISRCWQLACEHYGFRASSWHVHISRVASDNCEKAAIEISKYAQKPIAISTNNRRAWEQLVIHTKGSRTLSSAGSLHFRLSKIKTINRYEMIDTLAKYLSKYPDSREKYNLQMDLLSDKLRARIALEHYTYNLLFPSRKDA